MDPESEKLQNKTVKRRVAAIRRIIDLADIHHVWSKWNPADCACRGLDPRKFVGHELWFSGHPFLRGELSTTLITSGTVTCEHVAIDHPKPPTAVYYITRIVRRTGECHCEVLKVKV